MGETVTRNMYSKAIAENKNAIVASCWTYFTTIRSKLYLSRKNYYDFSFQAMLCLAVSFVGFYIYHQGC